MKFKTYKTLKTILHGMIYKGETFRYCEDVEFESKLGPSTIILYTSTELGRPIEDPSIFQKKELNALFQNGDVIEVRNEG